jgi:pimeloyl-ACP methyl ester carboxylesterase
VKKPRRWKRWIAAVLLGIFALGLILLHVFSDFSMSEAEIAERFATAGVVPTLETVEGQKVVETGNPEGMPVIFIHGSPGSWDNFIEYLVEDSLRERFHVMSINRLGYGEGGKEAFEASLSKQAAAVAAVLDSDHPAIVVGHSMGGPIAVKLAIEHPEKVKALVLLSAALDPKLEEVKGIQRIADWPLVAWMLPKTLVVCNRELMPLEGELEIMASEWSRLQAPVIALHGDEDGLVPVANMDFLKTKVNEAQGEIRILRGANHFIPWTHEKEVRQAILDAADL